MNSESNNQTSGSGALLSTADAAPLIGVSQKTLNNWRVSGKGPVFIKSGGNVRYDPADIEAWKASNRYQSTSEATVA